MKDIEGLSFRQIEVTLDVCRKKVSQLYHGNYGKKSSSAGTHLDEYRSLIHHWFSEHPAIRAKQIWQRLVDRGVKISRRSVERYTWELRQKRKPKVYWALDFLPGEEAQVDWFFLNHPRLGKLCGFVLVLSYSRYLFAHLFPRHGFEFFIEGHLMAFKVLGGYPRALRYDNLRSVVLKRQPLTYNPAFLEFARFFCFEIRLCNLAAGNEKGRVERAIRTLRQDFFNVVTHIDSVKALNLALHEWVDRKNQTTHRSTNQIPEKLLTQEKLKPLPPAPWINGTVHAPKRPTKTGFLIFETNRYSVPESCVGTMLSIRSFTDRIEICDLKGNKVATHKRLFERRQTTLNPHYRSFKRLSQLAKQERIHSVIKNLDPIVDPFLLINQQIGEQRYPSAYRIFKLLTAHSKETVLSAIREAVKRKNCRMKFVLSLLEPRSIQTADPVTPQKEELLQIQYTPRPLEEYDE